jgi:hypothetical protein
MNIEELRKKSIEQFAQLRRQALFEAQRNAPLSILPQVAAAGSSSGGSSGLPSGCIQLTVDTTEGTYFYFNFNTTGPINFTIDWGDGTTHDDSGFGGFYEENHDYPESDQQYTVRICFDDASIVTEFYSSND